MLTLTAEEFTALRSQFATRLRELAASHGDMAKRLDELKQKTEALVINHDTFSRDTHAQLKHVARKWSSPSAALIPPPRRRPSERGPSPVPLQSLIGSHILLLRDQRVMFDAGLAALYGLSTKALVQAVKRNLMRFSDDFMFQLSGKEFAALRSQTVTSNTGRGGRRTAPYAFTEQSVAMLSSVLGSPRAIAVNIEIMRTFVRVRALAMQHDTFSGNTRAQLKQVFDALRELMIPPEPTKRSIGFVTPEDKGKKPTAAKRKT